MLGDFPLFFVSFLFRFVFVDREVFFLCSFWSEEFF